MKTTTLTKITAVAAAALLTLTACSAGEEPTTETASAVPTASSSAEVAPLQTVTAEPAEETESTEDEAGVPEYAFATGMTFGKFTIPGDPDTGFVELMERYDDGAGDLDHVSFVNVKIDNREADENAWVMQVRVYDAAGAEYLFVDPLDLLDVMFSEDSSKMDYDDEYMKYFEKFNTDVSMGQVGVQTLISLDEMPDDIARVIVDTGAFAGDVEAVTIDEAESQGYPLDF